MASCITSKWTTTAPQVQLTVTQSASTDTTATLSYTAQYISKYPADASSRTYTIKLGSNTITGSYNIDGVTGTNTMKSGTVTINKGTASQSVEFSISFPFNLTWSGVYCGTLTASSSISVAAKTSYTVSYNANGGSGAPSSQTKWHGTNLTLSSTKPTRTGYTFKGWATSSSGSVAYASGATYSTNASVTLYAVWQALTYTVSYNANGGSGAPSSQTKTYGTALTLSSTKPTRTNYTFKGWGTSASSTTVAYAAGASYTENAAITLYAVWELSYEKPRITNASVSRCSVTGVVTSKGKNALISFSWACDKTVSSITVSYKLSSGTSWTDTSVTASGTSGNVSGLVVGSDGLDVDSTYDIRITVADSGGSSQLTYILLGTQFIIDILNGGKGVCIGGEATVENALDSKWDIYARKDIHADGIIYDSYGQKMTNGLSEYLSADDGYIDPNETSAHVILTAHANAPSGEGTFYYIITVWYSGKSTSAYRAQYAIPYNQNGSMYHRYYSGSWSNWKRHLNADEIPSTWPVSKGGTGATTGSAAMKKLGVLVDEIFEGSSQAAISFTLSKYDFVIVNGSPGSSSVAICTVICTKAGRYQFADDTSYGKFDVTSSGLSKILSGGGYYKTVIGVNLI